MNNWGGLSRNLPGARWKGGEGVGEGGEGWKVERSLVLFFLLCLAWLPFFLSFCLFVP